MYRFSSDIVIRYCLDKAFLINIKTNVILSVSASTIDYLLCEIEKGIEICDKPKGFFEFIQLLQEKGVLEVIPNEI